ncbi:MAG TPA: hypothetical protein VKA63_05755 [Candidatus Krumholzibacteria bacterium]|nr:hypothetical protein [Candidatus Krumholzibacteria bacterium]
MRNSRRFMFLGLMTATILVAASSVSRADVGSPLVGEMGLYFDAAGTVRSQLVPNATTFDAYLVVHIPEGGILSYDLVELKFSDPAVVFILGNAPPAGGAFVKQELADACSRAVAGESGCPAAAGEIVPLIRYQLQSVGGDPSLSLENFLCPTIAGTVITELYYESCDEPGVQKTLSLNPALSTLFLDGRVPVGELHWGTFKSRFGRE